MMAIFKLRLGLKKACAASLSLALTACATRPVCEPIRVPVVVEKEVVRIEPIPAELLREHPEATGDQRHCPKVARHNLEQLRACNDDKRLLRERQR